MENFALQEKIVIILMYIFQILAAKIYEEFQTPAKNRHWLNAEIQIRRKTVIVYIHDYTSSPWIKKGVSATL